LLPAAAPSPFSLVHHFDARFEAGLEKEGNKGDNRVKGAGGTVLQ